MILYFSRCFSIIYIIDCVHEAGDTKLLCLPCAAGARLIDSNLHCISPRLLTPGSGGPSECEYGGPLQGVQNLL